MSASPSRLHCMYHYPCPDGVFAALAAHLYATAASKEVVWHPMKVFLEPSAQLTQSLEAQNVTIEDSDEVFLMDYTGNAEFIHNLASTHAAAFTVLDHHDTAVKEIQALPTPPPHTTLVLDMDRSGATIARDYFCERAKAEGVEFEVSESLAQLFAFVEDADLWRWALADSKEFHAGLHALDIEYSANVNADLFDTLLALDAAAVIEKGREALAEEARVIDNDLSNAFVVNIPYGADSTLTCYAVIPTDPSLRSALGNKLAEKSRDDGHAAAGAVTYVEEELGADQYKVSLRSLKDTPVNSVAEHYNGGGHPCACSFAVSQEVFNGWRA